MCRLLASSLPAEPAQQRDQPSLGASVELTLAWINDRILTALDAQLQPQ